MIAASTKSLIGNDQLATTSITTKRTHFALSNSITGSASKLDR
jgi:hypothetical protein